MKRQGNWRKYWQTTYVKKDLYVKYSKNLRVKKENTLIRKLAKDMGDILSKTIYRLQIAYGKMFNIC